MQHIDEIIFVCAAALCNKKCANSNLKRIVNGWYVL